METHLYNIDSFNIDEILPWPPNIQFIIENTLHCSSFWQKKHEQKMCVSFPALSHKNEKQMIRPYILNN